MDQLEEALGDFRHGCLAHDPGDRTIVELSERGEKEPRAYRWDRKQRVFATSATMELLELAAKWQAHVERFEEGAPRPRPVLQVDPRI
jgi:hypothetical protein